MKIKDLVNNLFKTKSTELVKTEIEPKSFFEEVKYIDVIISDDVGFFYDLSKKFAILLSKILNDYARVNNYRLQFEFNDNIHRIPFKDLNIRVNYGYRYRVDKLEAVIRNDSVLLKPGRDRDIKGNGIGVREFMILVKRDGSTFRFNQEDVGLRGFTEDWIKPILLDRVNVGRYYY